MRICPAFDMLSKPYPQCCHKWDTRTVDESCSISSRRRVSSRRSFATSLKLDSQPGDLIDYLRVTLPEPSINVQLKNIPRNILYCSNLGRVERIDYDSL
jgi:hypothetical protein